MSFSHLLAILARYPLQTVLVQDCELSPIARKDSINATTTLGSKNSPCSRPSWLARVTLCCHLVYLISATQFLHRIPGCSVPPQPRNNASPNFRACPCMNKFASRLVVPCRAGNNGYKQNFPLSKSLCRSQVYPLVVLCVAEFSSSRLAHWLCCCGNILQPFVRVFH